MRKEDNGRIRYLNQYKPDEESRIRAAILAEYENHLPEFEIALHCGLRASEQYRLQWPDISLERKTLTVSKTKNGRTRHIPLNSVAVAVLQYLHTRAEKCQRVHLPG